MNESDPILFEVDNVTAVGMNQPVTIELTNHQICMLLGPSGSGKSQFLKALADLIGHKGDIKLLGSMQRHTLPCEWREQVMYFAVETAWWLDVVADHFNRSPTQQQLEAISLDFKVLQASPDQLSSGEKQRLALLRGLQYQPKILLLDEITANLHPVSEAQVETLIKQYVTEHNAAAIWISHNPEQISRLATIQLAFKGKKTLESAR